MGFFRPSSLRRFLLWTPALLGQCSLKDAGVQRSLRVPALFGVRCSLKNARGPAFSIARAGTYPIPTLQETLKREHAGAFTKMAGRTRAFLHRINWKGDQEWFGYRLWSI
ncbi:hypothetical protein QH637_02165 [Heyndrickxia coagulans]